MRIDTVRLGWHPTLDLAEVDRYADALSGAARAIFNGDVAAARSLSVAAG